MEVRRKKESDEDNGLFVQPVYFDYLTSTGSTLLDLAISGGRTEKGGIPSGIVMEVFGPSSAGKTAILASIAAHVKHYKGSAKFADPEGRLDQNYSEIYGLHLDKDEYFRPKYALELFKHIWEFKIKGDGVNALLADSLAAFSSKLEMSNDAGDKMGGQRAKDLHQLMRKTCLKIAGSQLLICFSNQLHDSMSPYGDGSRTPGGHAVPFFSSLRVRLANAQPIVKDVRVSKETVQSIHEIHKQLRTAKDGKKYKAPERKDVKTAIGIDTVATIKKSSVDVPYRTAPIRILFNYGIDDVGANIQWLKKIVGLSQYLAVDQEYMALDDAIAHVEEMDNGAEQLREQVIQVWRGVARDTSRKFQRKPRKLL